MISIIRNSLNAYNIGIFLKTIFSQVAKLSNWKKKTCVNLVASIILFRNYNISSSFCDSTSTSSNKNFQLNARESTIDQYVKNIMQNPKLNIQGIPDKIEQHIYRFTVKLTLDSILYWISSLQGKLVLGHRIELEYVQGSEVPAFSTPSLNHEALHSFVTSLLKEESINISWLPDEIEHRLYFNCLLLMLTVLHSSLGSLNIDFVGHRIAISLESSNMSNLIHQTAIRRSGLSEDTLNHLVTNLLKR